MKTLIVYYSRDGHTRMVAKELAEALGADIEEIYEVKSREGVLGYLSAGKDAMLKKQVEIKPFSVDPILYDLVIIGTPVWGFTMCCGVRSWLTRYGSTLKNVAFFATMGGSGDKRAFSGMAELCGQAPLAKASFIDKAIIKKDHREKLNAFIDALRKKTEVV